MHGTDGVMPNRINGGQTSNDVEEATRVLQKAGKNPRVPLTPMPRDAQSVKAVYEHHGSLKAAGNALGVSAPTFRKWLLHHGIPVKSRGGPNNPGGRLGKANPNCK